MKSFKKFFLENIELDEAAITSGDYSLVKTKEKMPTSKHPEGKFVHEIHHNGEKIGTVEPYSAYNEKRKPGARIVTSRTDATKYGIHFERDKGPSSSKDMSVSSKYGHANPKHALEAAARHHQFWKNKNEELDEAKKPKPGHNAAVLAKNISKVMSAVKKEEVELDETYDAAYVKRAIPALKNAVEFHKDTMEIHDKKSTKGSPEYVRAHSAAAAAHKEAAERHKIAHAQLSHGTKDIAYYINPARELGAYAEKLSDKANALKEEVELDEISKKLAKSYLDKSAAEREANPKYSTREKFRGRMIGGATADAKLKGRVEQPYKFGQAPKRKMYVKVGATNEEII
jgi:hypothetical protein